MDQTNTMWQQLAYLEQKINQQTQLLQELNQKIDQLLEQQSQSSNSIEYHFEQLKVETLEGTLNIGLTPQQELPFEQLDLPEESGQEALTPMEQQIYNQLMPYLRKDIPQLIDQFSTENDMEVSAQWKDVLIDDIKSQLPKRIKKHCSSFQQNGRVVIDVEQVPMLINHIKKEISEGVFQYLNQVKENKRED